MNVILTLICVVSVVLLYIRHSQLKNLQDYTKSLEEEITKPKSYMGERRDKTVIEQTEFKYKAIDALTGLPHYDAFHEHLVYIYQQAKRAHLSFALMLLDVDKFSEINKISYESGDRLLHALAKRLKSSIRQVDAVARYTGNRFLFVLPQLTKPEVAAYVAQRVQDEMLKPFLIDNERIFITACIGIAIYPHDGDSIESLLQGTNTALLMAKKRGPNQYQFFGDELQKMGERSVSVATLLKNGSFQQHLGVDYQVQVVAATDEIVGIQAYTYLQHPTLGKIAYEELMKIAENTNKYEPIVLWTLLQALNQLSFWQEEGIKIQNLTLNLPIQLIDNAQFLADVKHITDTLQNENYQLIFELSDVTDAIDATAYTSSLQLLNELGIQLATGIFVLANLALQNLRNFPFNYLKIDFNVLKHAQNINKNDEVLSAMIQLALEAGMQIVAENVDAIQQKELLEKLGCQIMQGKLFAHLTPARMPMASNELA